MSYVVVCTCSSALRLSVTTLENMATIFLRAVSRFLWAAVSIYIYIIYIHTHTHIHIHIYLSICIYLSTYLYL